MTVAIWLAWLVTAMTIVGRIALMKKWWWAPIYCIAQEATWAVFALVVDGAWPILVLVIADSAIYIAAIPKWYRERRQK